MLTTTEAEGIALYAQAASGPLASVPPEAWGPIGVVGAAALAMVGVIFGHWIGARNKARMDAGQLALQLATAQGEEIKRLNDRVGALETDRNAYRSWSHELWDHIHDEDTPRLPGPAWPPHLAR